MGSKRLNDPVEGRLIVWRLERPGYRTFDLYLFTNLLDSSAYSPRELVELYGLRWQAELNFRYLKTQMELHFLNCKSAEMAQKEWHAGLIAYNLIRSMMFLAAVKKGLDPLNLSFSGATATIRLAVLGWAEKRMINFRKLLCDIVNHRLPKRKKPRPNEPRLVRYLARYFRPLHGDRNDARLKVVNDVKS